MKLPYANRATISEQKLVSYLLNPEHPRGRGKASFFLGVGYRREEPQVLRQALLRLATTTDYAEMSTPFGRKFVGKGLVLAPSGHNVLVVTVWILADDLPPPALVTAYPSNR